MMHSIDYRPKLERGAHVVHVLGKNAGTAENVVDQMIEFLRALQIFMAIFVRRFENNRNLTKQLLDCQIFTLKKVS